MKKLTLREKKLQSTAGIGETKRCLAVLKRYLGDYKPLSLIYKQMIKEIIEDSPYIEFHPELLKRIPK